VRAARARNATRLAVACAATDQRAAAWQTLARSWRFSWPYRAWWAGIARVAAHTGLPTRLKTMVRQHRRAAQPAGATPMIED